MKAPSLFFTRFIGKHTMSDNAQNAGKELDALVGSQSTEVFTPVVFVKRNGKIGCNVKIMGEYGGVSPAAVKLIKADLDGLVKAAVMAIKMSQDPKHIAAARAKKGQPSGNSASGLDDELESLLG